ncbi:hypothetical protein [Streptomyces sp. E5N91]|uniref:hypothetical protein n=1 Tax=Streptomyces sp. E5N91 TaxID=1851996 RepID=UPI001290D002|nr:hypothetical protein [Streptomyces sp. E5N91]
MLHHSVKARQLSRAPPDAAEAHMEGTTPVDNGDDQEEQEEAAERRQERRRLIGQLLIDWSPVLAGVANLVVQYLS